MRRRDFVKLIAGSAATWPLKARAQQPAMPVVAVLNAIAANDKEAQPRATAFEQRLRELGRIKGSNIKIEHVGSLVGRKRCVAWRKSWLT